MVPLINNTQDVIQLPVATWDTPGHPKVLGDGTGTLLQACALLEQPQSLSRNCAQALASHGKVSVSHPQKLPETNCIEFIY